jgi:hypothetical protein
MHSGYGRGGEQTAQQMVGRWQLRMRSHLQQFLGGRSALFFPSTQARMQLVILCSLSNSQSEDWRVQWRCHPKKLKGYPIPHGFAFFSP